MIAVEKAKEILSDNARRGKTIKLPIAQTLGLVTAEDIYSPCDVPNFDNSAMDGYAIKWDEGNNRRKLNLSVSGKAGSGQIPQLSPDQAFRIFTGAPMPAGSDTVIPQEYVESSADELTFEIDRFKKGSNVRLQGNQNNKGDLILKSDSKITPGTIGLLASVGITEVPVYAPPSIAVVVTGDELKEIGEKLAYGEIYNSNGPTLQAYLKHLGVESSKVYKVKDEAGSLGMLVKDLLSQYDILLFSGGISVGDYDFVKEALYANGVEELFYKIKQRPGKPLFVGKTENQLVFALPGNPASVINCFNQYVKPIIKHWMGHSDVWAPSAYLPAANAYEKKPPLTFFLKGQTTPEGVRILGGQESFNLISFGVCDVFVEIPEEMSTIEKGTMLKVYNW